jgi:AraC-like DNA-binding protein
MVRPTSAAAFGGDEPVVATLRAATLTHFVEVTRQVGIDPMRALRRARIDPRALVDPEMRLPLAAVNQLLEDAASQSDCHTIGLRMGEMRRVSDMGAVRLLIAYQPTLRAALGSLVANQRLLNDSIVLNVEEADDIVICRGELVAAGSQPAVQLHQHLVVLMFRTVQALLGPHWRPLCVHFTHDQPADLSPYRRVFGADVEFRSEFNGFVLAAADLDRPNLSAEPILAQYAQRFFDSRPSAPASGALEQVRKAVRQLLPFGKASIGHVAQTLGLNARTLQRRLAAEQVEFSAILYDLRRDLAQHYLVDRSLSVTRIAQLLGYGQPTSFMRWFAAEFGASPTRWREERSEALRK